MLSDSGFVPQAEILVNSLSSFMTFQLGRHHLAVALEQVRATHTQCEVHRLRRAPGFVQGYAPEPGLVVLDVACLLGLPVSRPAFSDLLELEGQPLPVALAVDALGPTIQIDIASMKPTQTAVLKRERLLGSVRLGHRSYYVLDISQVLPPQDVEPVREALRSGRLERVRPPR